MIVQCPNCSTKYNLADDKFQEGRKVRCTVCKHVFPLLPTEPDFEAPPKAPDEEAFRPPRREEAGRKAEGAAAVDKDDLFDIDKEDKKRKRAKLPTPGEGKAKKKRGLKVSTILAGIILLLAAAVGAGYYFMPEQFALLGLPGFEGGNKTAKQDAISPEMVKNLDLDVNQPNWISNKKIGKVYVIQGKVVNRFETPKELIKLRADLFDANKQVVDSKTQMAGNTVSLFQLESFSSEELEATLNNKVGILTNNTNIPPGGEVPFVILFFNPPKSAIEMAVTVVEAKDPPKK